MAVDDIAFESLAEKTLHDLMEQIDDALGDRIDIDLGGGILHIELENGDQYVINKQAPNRQIWVSSPLSGAKHFYFDEELMTWIDTRSGEKLYDLLSTEMTQAAGHSFLLQE